jgi:hypothetical protein
MKKLLIIIACILAALAAGCAPGPAPEPSQKPDAIQITGYDVNEINQLRAWQSTANATINQQKAQLAELDKVKAERDAARSEARRQAANATDAANTLRKVLNDPSNIEMSCQELKNRYDVLVDQKKAVDVLLVDYSAREAAIWEICDNVSGYAAADNITEAIIGVLER